MCNGLDSVFQLPQGQETSQSLGVSLKQMCVCCDPFVSRFVNIFVCGLINLGCHLNSVQVGDFALT